VTQATCTLVFQMEGEAGKEQQQKKDLFGIKTCAKIASEKKMKPHVSKHLGEIIRAVEPPLRTQ